MPQVSTITLLTAAEAAALLRITVPRVYQLIAEGSLPAARVGHRIRIDIDVLRAWLNGGGAPAPHDQHATTHRGEPPR